MLIESGVADTDTDTTGRYCRDRYTVQSSSVLIKASAQHMSHLSEDCHLINV